MTSETEKPTQPRINRAAFPLSEGLVYMSFPADMSADAYEELGEYLAVFISRGVRKPALETSHD